MRQEDFDRLYHEHARPLLGFLAYRTGDRPLAEDLLAETFEKVLRSRTRLDPRRGSEKAWLYTIALNCLRDHARRQSAESRALAQLGAGQATSSDPLGSVEARRTVQEALEVLSEEEREAIALRYGGDLTIPEIATVTKEPLTTVEGRVYRALRKLRDELSE